MANKSVMDMVKHAKTGIENLTPEQVSEELANNKATLIDLRESEEFIQNGRIPGAIHAPRGMVEFYADETTPYHRPEFDKNKRLIFHCAGGGRSALTVATLKEMGYNNIAHLDGGIKAWKEAGKPVIE